MATVQLPGLNVTGVSDSCWSTSERVSQPSLSASTQCWKRSRLYPVFVSWVTVNEEKRVATLAVSEAVAGCGKKTAADAVSDRIANHESALGIWVPHIRLVRSEQRIHRIVPVRAS